MEGLILLLGGLEIVLGGLMTAHPGLLPTGVGWFFVFVGVITILYALYMMRRDAWQWILEKGSQAD